MSETINLFFVGLIEVEGRYFGMGYSVPTQHFSIQEQRDLGKLTAVAVNKRFLEHLTGDYQIRVIGPVCMTDEELETTSIGAGGKKVLICSVVEESIDSCKLHQFYLNPEDKTQVKEAQNHARNLAVSKYVPTNAKFGNNGIKCGSRVRLTEPVVVGDIESLLY